MTYPKVGMEVQYIGIEHKVSHQVGVETVRDIRFCIACQELEVLTRGSKDNRWIRWTDYKLLNPRSFNELVVAHGKV